MGPFVFSGGCFAGCLSAGFTVGLEGVWISRGVLSSMVALVDISILLFGG